MLVKKLIRRPVIVVLIGFLFLCLFSPFSASAANTPTVTPKPFPVSELHAQAAYLLNADNGDVLYANNEDATFSTASLTKIMTLLIVEEQLKAGKIKLSDKVKISLDAWHTAQLRASSMFLEVGQVYTIEDLIKGLAVISGNDAAVSLAEDVAGSQDAFVAMMNQKAKDLGMTHTNFKTVGGLPVKGSQGDTSSAKDMAILANYYIKQFPDMLKIHSMKKFTTITRQHPITQPNNNSLLGVYKGLDGLMTGYNDYYNFIGTAKQGKNRLIVIVMGAPSLDDRAATATNLLNYGFQQYQTYTAGKQGEVIASLPVYKAVGIEESSIVVKNDIVYGINVRDASKVKIDNQIPDHLEGGLHKGDKVGTQVVTLDGKVIASGDIVATQDLPKTGWFLSIFHQIALFFHELLNKYLH